MFKHIFIVVFFICFGITTEVFFTAFYELISSWVYPENVALNYNPRKLEGHTYVWMAFIYALIPLLFPLGIKWFGHLNIIIRSIIYMIAIFIIEFIGGFLLDSLTGFCPWDYTGSTWSVMGYIRLDYFPAWMVFGIIVETFYKFVSEKIKD